MFGGLTTRGQLDPVTQLEFERLYARLNEFLSVSFTEDGELITPAPAGVVPVGAIINWGTDTAPDKWLFLEGQALSRVTYKGLFEIYGTTHGAGDGSTTFNLPDARGKFILAQATAGTGATLGSTGGSLDHTHTIPGHSHTVSVSGTTNAGGGHGHSASGSSSTDGAHTHTQGAHNHAISSIGRLDTDGDQAGATVHGASATQVDIFNDSGTGSSGSHTHSISVSVDSTGDHTHTFSGSGSTNSTSSATSDGANPPFIVLKAIIYTGVSA